MTKRNQSGSFRHHGEYVCEYQVMVTRRRDGKVVGQWLLYSDKEVEEKTKPYNNNTDYVVGITSTRKLRVKKLLL